MATYALIAADTIVSGAEWDGVTPWTPPNGWTAIPWPEGAGVGWSLVDGVWTAPPPAPVPAPEPVRIPKIDFLRLFTAAETAAFQRRRREVAALTVADYDDPAQAGLVALESFLLRFDATDTFEVGHPDIINGVALLVALGVLTEQRAAQVLAGEAPPA